MKTILVVDDMRIFSDAIAATMKVAGYRALTAADGAEAIKIIRDSKPDLVLLDLGMPVLDGLATLKLLRSDAETRGLPVIVLTALSDRDKVLQAAKLGVRDFLLKSRFSLAELTERVKLRLADGICGVSARTSKAAASAQGDAAPVPPSTLCPPASPKLAAEGGAKPAIQAAADGSLDNIGPIPQLLTRAACLSRVAKVMEGKTLSGVVAQVISTATSPRTDLAQLATLIGRDPALSVKVLRAANSPVYASRHGPKTTIAEAVRNIGVGTVRDVAAAMSVFEVMPETAPDGFNPIRCWQHSFAVARLCEHLAASHCPESAGVAYLVGLCHDLVQIMFRAQFGKEYTQVLDWEARSGKPRTELEKVMLGVEHGELIVHLLERMGIPEAIQRPIAAFHGNTTALRGDGDRRLVRMLQMAESYANGLLLACGRESTVSPLTIGECKAATGQDHPQPLDALCLRSEVISMTAMLARLSAADEAKLMAPLYPSSERPVGLVRDTSFSAFDPIEGAIGSIAAVKVFEQVPPLEVLQGFKSLVIASRNASATGLGSGDLDRLRNQGSGIDLDVIWLTHGNQKADLPDRVTALRWPITLERLVAALGLTETTPQWRPGHNSPACYGPCDCTG